MLRLHAVRVTEQQQVIAPHASHSRERAKLFTGNSGKTGSGCGVMGVWPQNHRPALSGKRSPGWRSGDDERRGGQRMMDMSLSYLVIVITIIIIVVDGQYLILHHYLISRYCPSPSHH